MEKKKKRRFRDFDDRLKGLDPRVRRKALELASGMISVYGLTEAHAIEEGIKRAMEKYGEV